MPIRKAVDLTAVLDWMGRVLTLVWIAKGFQRIANSRKLLFLSMSVVRMLAHKHFNRLGGWRGHIYFSLNSVYLRLAIKFDPNAQYLSDYVFPWEGSWGKPGVLSSMDIPWNVSL